MNLPLYSSTTDLATPNLVGLQHPALASLPTQLVCAFRQAIAVTPLREVVVWKGKDYVAACDLIQPIRSLAMKQVGELNNEASARI
ncbi:MAG TPA: hypothetical protein VIS96_08420 [Terrimicrobiaceae bacterium]